MRLGKLKHAPASWARPPQGTGFRRICGKQWPVALPDWLLRQASRRRPCRRDHGLGRQQGRFQANLPETLFASACLVPAPHVAAPWPACRTFPEIRRHSSSCSAKFAVTANLAKSMYWYARRWLHFTFFASHFSHFPCPHSSFAFAGIATPRDRFRKIYRNRFGLAALLVPTAGLLPLLGLRVVQLPRSRCRHRSLCRRAHFAGVSDSITSLARARRSSSVSRASAFLAKSRGVGSGRPIVSRMV